MNKELALGFSAVEITTIVVATVVTVILLGMMAAEEGVTGVELVTTLVISGVLGALVITAGLYVLRPYYR